jgi:hypothetical protein
MHGHFRFSLKKAFLCVAVCAAIFAIVARQWHTVQHRRQMLDVLANAGGKARIDEFLGRLVGPARITRPGDPAAGPSYVRKMLGDVVVGTILVPDRVDANDYEQFCAVFPEAAVVRW